MRRFRNTDNPYEIRDKVVPIYLKRILRRFRKLNQSLLAFDEVNTLTSVNEAYDEVISITVDALKEIAKRTYKWANGSDDGFLVDMWIAGFLDRYDPVMHYAFYTEADRKRSRLFEALESVETKSGRKEQIDIALRYWSKQFEQTADEVVNEILLQVYRDNNIRYVKWVTMHDAKVCAECHSRDGKIYPIDSNQLCQIHWNCRCWWIPVR